MTRCEVCGRRLNIQEFLKGLRTRDRRSYPFVTMGGERNEQSVRYICIRCEGRAERHRSNADKQPGNGEASAVASR